MESRPLAISDCSPTGPRRSNPNPNVKKGISVALPLLTQGDLVRELAEETGWSQSDVRRFLEGMGQVIENNVEAGYRLRVCGIQIEPKLKKATKKRKGRNPATGEEITIKARPASVVLKIKPVKPLTDVKLPSARKLAA
jgi:nucleoid DNA-binding protein